MSGGHFDYRQNQLLDIADEISEEIRTNDSTKDNGWGGTIGNQYSKETIDKFKEAAKELRIAQVKVQRIDWLLSGDDGEETFHKRWVEDLTQVEKENEFK